MSLPILQHHFSRAVFRPARNIFCPSTLRFCFSKISGGSSDGVRGSKTLCEIEVASIICIRNNLRAEFACSFGHQYADTPDEGKISIREVGKRKNYKRQNKEVKSNVRSVTQKYSIYSDTEKESNIITAINALARKMRKFNQQISCAQLASFPFFLIYRRCRLMYRRHFLFLFSVC